MALTPATKYLMDWFVRYTKNRDLIFRKIAQIKEDGNTVVVTPKSGDVVIYHIEPFPEDLTSLADSIKEKTSGIVVYNSAENFTSIISSWKTLSAHKNLTLFFVNPFSKLDKKWIVKPYIHGRISEEESLKEGLNSIYQMVEPISKKEVDQLTQ